MTDEVLATEGGEHVDLSTEELSTEIGSGAEAEAEVNVEAEAAAEDIKDAIEDGASPEEIKELIETFNIKVNGEEKEVTLDWNNKEDIVKRLQMAEAGQGAMQKAAEMEKGFEGAYQELLDNPWKTLEDLGFDVDDLAEKRIQGRIEQMKKSPEQLATEARDSELEALRQQLKEEAEAREDIDFQRMQQEAEVDLDNQITEALSSTTELPKSPYVVKRIADAMLSAMENGRDDVTAKDVIPWVEKEINEEMQGLFSSMPDKVLEQYLGNQTIERLRKNRLSKMTTQGAKTIKETGTQAPADAAPKKAIKLGDWLKHGSSITDL